MPESMINLIMDNLETLTTAKRFEIWRKARNHYNELCRCGKSKEESQWAFNLMSIAYSAYMWNR